MRRALAGVSVNGFSHSTWTPRRRNSVAISSWVSGGVQISTASMVGPSSARAAGVANAAQAKRSAIAFAASARTSHTATSWALGLASKAWA